MDKQSIIQYKSSFDAITSYIEGEGGKEQVEVWFARDLMTQLGYSRWENFHTAINRAVDSCNSLGVNIDNHFREVTKTEVVLSVKFRTICSQDTLAI